MVKYICFGGETEKNEAEGQLGIVFSNDGVRKQRSGKDIHGFIQISYTVNASQNLNFHKSYIVISFLI